MSDTRLSTRSVHEAVDGSSVDIDVRVDVLTFERSTKVDFSSRSSVSCVKFDYPAASAVEKAVI